MLPDMIGSMLLVIVLQTPAAAAQAGNATAARQAFDEGNALFEKLENEKALAAYDRAIGLDKTLPDAHLGRCRTLARLQRHDEAIASCSEAINLKPDFAAAFLDRGHFLINARKADRALPDLARARTLNADPYGVAYHLALANYLTGEYQKAAVEYDGCLADAKTVDNTIACSAWQYLALLRAGRRENAAKVLERATPDVPVQSSAAYLDRLLLFKGVKTEEEVARAMEKDNLQLPTIAYGLGVWHLVNGREARAREYFRKATSPPAQQSAFGSVAAYYELQRMNK
jgi:tetratricopeptide (TPR) repeat protein